jgi:hypothetical protein
MATDEVAAAEEVTATEKVAAAEQVVTTGEVATTGGTPYRGGVTFGAKGPRWRRALAWVFLVLGCLLLPLAVTGGWVRGNIMSTDGFVETVGPLSSEPAIQSMVAGTVTRQLFEAIDLEDWLRQAFPSLLGFMVPAAVAQIEGWVEGQAERLVATEQFGTVWTAAARTAHQTVADFFRGTGTVQLGPEGTIQMDVSPISIRITDTLGRLGITLDEEEYPILSTGKVPIIQVDRLESIRGLLWTLNRLFIVLPILAVVFLAASVAVATRRQRAALRAGIGIMISMAVFAVILAVGRTQFLGATRGAGVTDDASEVLWGALALPLKATAWVLFAVGFLLFIYYLIAGGLAPRAAERATGWDTGRVGAWIAKYRLLLSLAVLVIGFLVLVLWDSPGLVAIAVTGILVILGEALIAFLARQSELATRARASD